MYRITFGGSSVTTETVTYIKRRGPDLWAVTDERHAEGVAVSGQMLPWDQVAVQTIDSGSEIDEIHTRGKTAADISADQDEILLDQEYRLEMLELGV